MQQLLYNGKLLKYQAHLVICFISCAWYIKTANHSLADEITKCLMSCIISAIIYPTCVDTALMIKQESTYYNWSLIAS